VIGQAAPGLSLTRLRLTDFRGYAALDWAPAARIVVVTGPNGAGKTNLLEAISLLVPGRGLRAARMSEMARADGPGGFAVSARFATPEGPLALGTACAPGATSRAFQLDGEVPRTQAEIAARVAAVWLTPQMDSLFRDGAGTRRRFLDRLVYALEPAHAREVAAYDNAMAQRNRLLAEGGADPAWLAGLEDAMARHGVAAAAARAGLAQHLSAMLAAGAVAPFPTATLAVDCTIGRALREGPALAAEEAFRARLAAARARDAAAGATLEGPHRADLAMTHAEKNLPAALCSTGEQKALLVATVLAHALLVAEARGVAPLLLLDEAGAHLDEARRQALFDALRRLRAQCFLTGTEAAAFLPLAGAAAGFLAGAGQVAPDRAFPAVEPGFLL
jgi:DNA replication and repair protein RecF